jgi:hypothetical protein
MTMSPDPYGCYGSYADNCTTSTGRYPNDPLVAGRGHNGYFW